MDYQQNFVKKFTNTGTPIDISGTDMGSYAYQAPYTVAIDSVGNVYVADIFLNRIIKFNSSYTFVSNITGNSGAFNSPQGVSVDGSDNVYVLDSGNNRVQKFNSSGTWQLTITGNGSAFNYPEAMTVDTNGNIYVADSGNNRIQIFNTSGVFQQEITSSDVNTGTGSPISYLSGMGFQNPNTLFVGDNTRSFKIVFDHDDPTISINSLPGNDTSDTTPSITGTASDTTTAITNVEYRMDAGSYSSCTADDAAFDEVSETFTCDVSPALSLGSHTIDIRGTDSKTNVDSGATLGSYTFTVSAAATPTPSPSPSSSSGSSPSPEASVTKIVDTYCSALPPDSAPDIFKITRTDDKVTIFYAPISSNVTKYQVMYGYKAGDERFATSFDAVVSSGALKFEVSDLMPTQTYVFWMKGLNDCAPGPVSNNYTTHGIVLSPDTSETKNSSPSASAPSNLTPWSGMTPSNSSTPGTSSSAETSEPLSIQLTLVDLLGMPLSQVPLDITSSHDSVAHVVSTKTDKDGKSAITINPGDYTITTSYNDSSYSKVVKILPKTDSLTVRFPTPLRDAFLRQVYAPIDASYGVKAGIGVVSLGWITTSLFSFLIVSRTILASLATVYRNSSRSILRLPIDYIANLMRFSSLGFAARIAPIMPSLGKKKKSNGLVFDAYTFKPIAKAFVVLFSKSGNLKTDYTDLHGRYSFDSVAPDEYQMRSEISGYKFPSSIITTPQTLGMDHVYMQGETIPVTDENSYLEEIALAMDPTDKSGILYRLFHFGTSGLINIYRKLTVPLAGLGLTTVAYATATNPSQFNQAIAIICGIYTFSSLSLHSKVKKMSGRVLDFARNPVSDAYVKLFKINQNGETGSLYTSTKTDKQGRYFLQPEIGNYILEMTTNDGEKITQTLRIMKNVPSVDKEIIAAGA